MKEVQLGFKAFDLHELGCHFVAQSAGFYAERRLDVSLVDTRLMPDEELPEHLFSTACGSAVIRWLLGEKLKVVLVAAERPMFWLYSNNGVARLEDLRGRKIATFPDASPPAHFLRIILEQAQLDTHGAVSLVPARDDGSRLEMLRRGDAAAALISSAILPCAVEALGFRKLLCVGDHFRLPTTGLAVRLDTFQRYPETVNAMRDAHRAALRLIHGDRAGLHRALEEAELVDTDFLDSSCELLREFFTSEGQVQDVDVRDGLRRLADSLDVEVPRELPGLYACNTAY